MGLYERTVFNPLMDRLLGQPAIHAERERLLAQAGGDILEIGIGTGLNLTAYPPGVARITSAAPGAVLDPRARRRAEERGITVEAVDASAEALPLPDGAFDTAVATFVLCSVADARAAIAELRRVLRPNGRLLFLEHVARPPGPGRLVQRALDPLNRVIACGCHLTRDTEALLAADFDLVESETSELPALPWLVRRVIRGSAVPRPR